MGGSTEDPVPVCGVKASLAEFPDRIALTEDP